MTNPLLKAAGIPPATRGFSAERALFDAASKCVDRLCGVEYDFGTPHRVCCRTPLTECHAAKCPLVAFDEAAKNFQELEQKS